MRFMLMPRESSWWIWLGTALLLVVGLVWTEVAFVGGILLSAASAGFHLRKYHSYMPYPVQIRLAFTALLIISFAPFLRWFYWLLAVGAFARVLFGYCMMARGLSLMPWNRTEPVTLGLLQRTFLTPPVVGNPAHGLSDSGRIGGVCELDGGGSSVMAVRDPANGSFRILNQPTDGRERAVANALGISVR
jgi:hypothetical protein